MNSKKQKQEFRLRSSRIGPDTRVGDEVYHLQALLGRYGYLRGAYSPGVYDEPTRVAVAQFQSFYRLYPEEDGVCDQATVDLLNLRRCGVRDPLPAERAAMDRLASYVTVGAKWPRNALAYRYLNSTPDLPVDGQHTIIDEAFRRWAAVSALQFREVPPAESSDLSVAFHRGSHGDGNPFDDAGGPDGNTLAHAFYPPPRGGAWAGSLHFDEYETWKDQPGGSGIRLFNVALHEIGHLLGLAHSQDSRAIMYAYYAEDRSDLQPDDVAGIQSLYGAQVAAPVAIKPGETVSGHLPQANAEVRYQVILQNKLLLRLDGPSGQDFDLYVRYGGAVGTQDGQYDFVSYGLTADELITIDNPRAGTYYVLVHSYRGSGSYTLEVNLA
jgi:predicted Zn-dependent protease